jgi:hypothetical protein
MVYPPRKPPTFPPAPPPQGGAPGPGGLPPLPTPPSPPVFGDPTSPPMGSGPLTPPGIMPPTPFGSGGGRYRPPAVTPGDRQKEMERLKKQIAEMEARLKPPTYRQQEELYFGPSQMMGGPADVYPGLQGDWEDKPRPPRMHHELPWPNTLPRSIPHARLPSREEVEKVEKRLSPGEMLKRAMEEFKRQDPPSGGPIT